MARIKDTIEDYIAEFRFKSRPEKIRALQKLALQAVVVVGLICAPVIITMMHETVEGEISTQRMPELSVEQKWRLVRMGRLRVDCVSNASETLKKLGMDMSTADGMDYAIAHGLCDFHMN